MKSIISKTSLFLLTTIATLSACEKVIDLDINEADAKIVIEGAVSNSALDTPEVRISKTVAFEREGAFSGVSGAQVRITVNNGSTFSLAETKTGIYKTTGFVGIPGNRYTLSVIVDGKTYTSESVMPQPVKLDSLTWEYFGIGNANSITIYPRYKDPVGLGNAYRFIEYVNGEQVKAIFVQNDNLSDGLVITRPLLKRESTIELGDTVHVKMQCIDAAVYKYWYSLEQAGTGENQSATPANPVSNISGGSLGYFSAHPVSSRTLIIR